MADRIVPLKDTDNTPLILKWAPGPLKLPKNPKRGHRAQKIFFERPVRGKKHILKMRERHIMTTKRCIFALCHFPSARSKSIKTHALNNMHFGSILGCLIRFSYFQGSMFLSTPRKMAKTMKHKAHLESPLCALGLPNSPRAIPIPRVGPKDANSEFWRGPKDQS